MRPLQRALSGACGAAGRPSRPADDWPPGPESPGRGLVRPGRDPRLRQRPVVAASYCSTTLAGMRPRALTAMPWSFAYARMPRRGHGLPLRGPIAAAVLVRPSGRARRTAPAACGTPGRPSCSGRSRTPRRPARTARSPLPGRRQDRLPGRPLSSSPSRPPCLRWLSAPYRASARAAVTATPPVASHPRWCARRRVTVRSWRRAIWITRHAGSAATPGRQAILQALDLPEPPTFPGVTTEAGTTR
jgi:hypothetical protein